MEKPHSFERIIYSKSKGQQRQSAYIESEYSGIKTTDFLTPIRF
jgi:hypothetical protein